MATDEIRETYCVWPDGTIALLCEVAEGLYSEKGTNYQIMILNKDLIRNLAQ